MPKPPPPPKPKINWRLWLRLCAWAAVCASAAWGAREVRSYLKRDPDFTLETLEIKGAIYASQSRLRTVFENDFGKSVFQVPLAERRRHLLAVDWVRTASLTRIFPNRIVVTITERRPVSFAKLPVAGSTRHTSALVDEDGVLLSIPSRVRFRLPLLSGISDEQSDDERRIRVAAMRNFLTEMGGEAKQFIEINVASTQDLRVMANIENQPVELWMGNRRYHSRYMNFLNHYGEIRKHLERATVFDLRMDDRILAR